jgi:amino acid permease
MMIWKALLALAVIAWVIMFVSGSGVLIESEKTRRPGDGQDSLVCRYFIATSVIEQTFWYAPNGFMGKAACPRLIRV